MRTYQCDPAIEVSGSVVASITNNLASDRLADLPAQHGLQAVELDRWYRLCDVFDFLNDVAAHNQADPQVFVAMGMRISEQSEFPADMRTDLTLRQILEGWQAHYEANHRGGYLPPVRVKKISDCHYKMILASDHLYPYDFNYGMLYGFCKQLLPRGTRFVIKYDDEKSAHNPGYHGEVIIDMAWGEDAAALVA